MLSSSVTSGKKRQKSGGRVASDSCLWCGRQWTSENPVVKDRPKKPTLPRVSTSGPCLCTMCTGTWRWCCKGKDKEGHKKQLATSEVLQQWMQLVTCYEKRRNGHEYALPEGFELSAAQETISNAERPTLLRSGSMGNCWPVSVWRSWYKADPPKERLTEGEELSGSCCVGVEADPANDPFPLPRGVVQLTVQRSTGTKRLKEVANSRDYVREEQGDDMWRHQQAKFVRSKSDTEDHEQHTFEMGGSCCLNASIFVAPHSCMVPVCRFACFAYAMGDV